MKRLCDYYIKNAEKIGVLFCAIPATCWFLTVLILVPFRAVYVLRLILSLTIGGFIAARLNRHGLEMWIAKHKSRFGPATIYDGILNGAAIGIGIALFPAITSLIKTNHVESAKSFIIISYLASVLLGGLMGGFIASIGKKYIERD